MTALPWPTRRLTPLLLLLAALGVALIGLALWGREAASLIGARPAGLTETEIAAVGVAPPPGARAPLGLKFRTLDGQATTLGAALGGRPGVLVLADYGCRNLCGPALNLTAAALRRSGLAAGADYRFAVVGLDPATPPSAARTLVEAQLAAPTLAAATTALRGDAASTPALAAALGYRYRWDAVHRQFAHPVAAFVLARDGRLIRALSEIGLDPADLRLALAEAGGGSPVGGAATRILAHCYGFDPALGTYNRGVSALVKLASAAMLAGGLAIGARAVGRGA